MKMICDLSKLLFILITSCLASCQESKPYQTTGYVSANLIYLSSPLGGYLDQLSVKEGDSVKKNDLIYKLNDQPEIETLSASRAKWRAAKANLAEIKRLKPQTSQNQLNVAKEKVSASLANVNAAEWGVDTKTMRAPAGGILSEIYYQPGEFVLPMHPVASLFVPNKMKIVFYVPENHLRLIKLHQPIKIVVANKDYVTHIINISQNAEFTPEIMFSETNKHQMIFKVTAQVTPELRTVLKAGQPVDVNYEP